jgi:hypothetical protein
MLQWAESKILARNGRWVVEVNTRGFSRERQNIEKIE